MALYIAVAGAALLAYVVYLISGVGVAITAFVGIMLIVCAIWRWFYETNKNIIVLNQINKDAINHLGRKIK